MDAHSDSPLPDSGDESKPLITKEESELIRNIVENNSPPIISHFDHVQDQNVTSTCNLSKSSGSRSRHESYNLGNGPMNDPSSSSQANCCSPSNSSPKSQSTATLYDYMYNELRRGYILENDEQRYRERREKFYIFMKIPVQLEKVKIQVKNI